MKTDERNKFAIKSFLGEYLDLRKDKDNELATVDSIRKGVEFKGANLWILIFAIFMASLGLNVNSTAVIIGAMLISPLMGPIMGVGLSVGLNDFELMKRSLKSFLITTAFSVTTATIFFLLAPIAGSQSELLARTSPTIYDVFIALFGGLAGVVALSTKEKGNVIPGVAIATALMPPLCTAGYGLASGNLIYFLGAFYLYFINSVFISLATFLGVRVMHFQRKEFVDKTREKTVRKYIVLIVVLTMCGAMIWGWMPSSCRASQISFTDFRLTPSAASKETRRPLRLPSVWAYRLNDGSCSRPQTGLGSSLLSCSLVS